MNEMRWPAPREAP